MTNILKTIVAILITATLTACGQPAAKNTANVSAPTSVTVTEADSLSSYEVQTSTEVTDIPSAEPSADPAAVTPASDEAVASATSEETSPYSDYIWAWYEDVSEPANYPTQNGDNGKIAITSDSIVDSGIGYLITAYDFTDSMKSGSSVVTENNQASSFPYEGRYGVDAYIDGMTLYAKAYSNMGYNPTIESVAIKTADGRTVSVNGINYNGYTQINLSGYSKTCRLVTTFDYNGFSVENKLNVYVNVDEAWLCKLTSMSVNEFSSRRDKIATITSDLDITPENSLGLDEIMYPITDGDRFRRDTDLWAELSEEIITDDSWSDEYKVVLIHDWIVNNIAYDSYRQYTLNTARDYYNHDWSGTYSVYNTHTGVCFDLSHIFLIMCRHNGIPCVILENDTHIWNGVWLDGKWQELDLCDDVNRFTKTADTTVITTTGAPGYGSLDNTQVPRLIYVNQTLWTYECVWGSGVNYGWYYK